MQRPVCRRLVLPHRVVEQQNVQLRECKRVLPGGFTCAAAGRRWVLLIRWIGRVHSQRTSAVSYGLLLHRWREGKSGVVWTLHSLDCASKAPVLPVDWRVHVEQTPCPAGRFGDEPLLTSSNCSGVCADGYQCESGSVSPFAAPCEAGYNCTNGVKEPCAAGWYSLGAATVCSPCTAGRFSAQAAATSTDACTPCPYYDNAVVQEGSPEGAAHCWPGLLYANASNPPPLVVGFSVGDVVTLVFTKATNTPSAPLSFQPSIGEVRLTWLNQGATLIAHVVDAGGSEHPIDPKSVDVGRLTVSLVGVCAWGDASVAMPMTPLLVGGTWGVPSVPVIVTATATNTGLDVGFGAGDSVAIVFDQDVNRPDVSTLQRVLSVVTFSPLYVNAAVAWGRWEGTRTLMVYFGSAADALTNDSSVRVGALSLAVLPTGDIRSENNETLPSNATTTVASGSWGDVPTVQLVDKSSTALRVLLGTPDTAFNYTAQRFWLQWSALATFAAVAAPTSWKEVLNETVSQLQLVPTIVTARDGAQSNGVVTVDYCTPQNGGANASTQSSAVVITLPTTIVLAAGATISFDLEGLTPRAPCFVRAASNNDGFDWSDVVGPVAPSSPLSLVPLPPRILSLVTSSATLLCVGGQDIVVTGTRLGRVGDVATLTLVNQRRMRFATAPCIYVTELTTLSCVSPSGVGGNLTATVTVDGVVSDEFAGFSLSYGVPTIASMSGPAAANGDTAGGTVRLHGANFGSVALNAIDRVVYAPVGLSFEYTAQCDVTGDDVVITCQTPEGGVGARVLWTVTIAGLESVNPRTGYHPPLLTSIQAAAAMDVASLTFPANGTVSGGTTSDSAGASLLTQLFTDGGHVLIFSGDYFGVKGAPLNVFATGVGLTERDATTVLSSPCDVVNDHVTAVCGVPVGVGHDFVWTITVASQKSSNVAPRTTSYAAPTVSSLAITVAGVATTTAVNFDGSISDAVEIPTDGSATIALIGTNFGTDAKGLSLRWNGQTVLDVSFVSPHRVMQFSGVSGPGGDILLTLTIGGQPAFRNMSNAAASLANVSFGGDVENDTTAFGLRLRYAAPQVVYLDIPVDVNNGSSINCNAVTDSDSTGTRRAVVGVRLHGANFGDGTATRLSFNGVDESASIDWTLSSHTQLLFFTPYCEGVLVVTVAGRRSANVTYQYRDLVAEPAVSTVEPGHGPAAGGTSVTITGLSFQLGGTVAFVRPSGLQMVGECAWRGIPGMSYDLEAIKCVVPKGAGSNIAIQITVNGVVSMSSPLWSYDLPVVSYTTPSVLLPQGSGLLTIVGVNFGDSSLWGPQGSWTDGLLTATIDSRGCVQDSKSAAVAKATSWNDSRITCVYPVGVQAASSLVVSVYGQSSAVTVVRYAPPSITAISPLTMGTAGGDTITIIGGNFSAVAPATVAVKFAQLSRPTAESLPCRVTAVSTTSISCVAPTGAGTRWYAVVVNSDLNGTVMQASVRSGESLSYRPPNITALMYDAQGAPAVGGFTIRVVGTDFSASPVVTVTGLPCEVITSRSEPHVAVSCLAPPMVAGTDATVVLAAGGQLANAGVVRYDRPVVTAVSPATLDARFTTGRGGVSITGLNFGKPTVDGVPGSIPVNHSVTVGGIPCDGVVWTSDTLLACVALRQSFVVGAVTVQVMVGTQVSQVRLPAGA